MARHLPCLKQLWTYNNKLGQEGVREIGNALTNLETLWLNANENTMQGIGLLGRLPSLKELYACTVMSQHRED